MEVSYVNVMNFKHKFTDQMSASQTVINLPTYIQT